MAARSKQYWIILLFMILSKSPFVHSWDAIDFELFDLVEEVKGNFYDILGLQQVSCSKFIVELTKFPNVTILINLMIVVFKKERMILTC